MEESKELRKCEICGTVIPKESNRCWNSYRLKKYCSRECAYIGNNHKIKCYCEYCGKELLRSPSHVRTNIYCSRECRSKARTFEGTCATCGRVFRRAICTEGKSVYCSHKCQWESMRKHNEQNQGRRSPEDIEWKKNVLEKDGYKCFMCGSDRNLQAHHIKPIEQYPELRHELSNGITVCKECHYYKIHNGMPNYKHGKYCGDYAKRVLRGTRGKLRKPANEAGC